MLQVFFFLFLNAASCISVSVFHSLKVVLGDMILAQVFAPAVLCQSYIIVVCSSKLGLISACVVRSRAVVQIGAVT